MSDPSDTNNGASASPTPDNPSGYSERHSRITKENLFMILALWMEDFPVSLEGDGVSEEDGENPKATNVEGGEHPKPPCKKVGAVLVSSNDIIYAADCTRDGVHGIVRLLIKHHDIPEGCKVFVSRKPCSFCAKLLVQSGKVNKVFYLPFEPEYYTYSESEFKYETVRVDTLFKASAIGQSVFVPSVEKAVLDDAEKRKKTPSNLKEEIENRKSELFKKYYKEDWMKPETARKHLPWPAFDDHMQDRVKKDFEGTMEWMARILVLPEKAERFILSPFHGSGTDISNVPFNPKDELQRKQAVRLLKMARFLAERSDDPSKGVGAIITDQEMEIKALGWNGFPLKALYGEFPRASDRDDDKGDKKFPYVIHAEQNALLMRNDKNLKEGTLFVTKTPCDECVPLLQMQGIKTVVSDETAETLEEKKTDNAYLTYELFPKKVKEGVFLCFERPSSATGDGPKDVTASDAVNLQATVQT